MGEEVNSGSLGFVSFEPDNGGFRAFLSVGAALDSESDPEDLARQAAAVYARLLGKMRSAVEEIDALRRTRTPVSARRVWQLGDLVFRLTRGLAELDLELDGVYEHLSRDLNVKRKWLEKVIILRRYIEDVSLIPESLNWGRVEKGTARAARRISEGLQHNGSDTVERGGENRTRGS